MPKVATAGAESVVSGQSSVAAADPTPLSTASLTASLLADFAPEPEAPVEVPVHVVPALAGPQEAPAQDAAPEPGKPGTTNGETPEAAERRELRLELKAAREALDALKHVVPASAGPNGDLKPLANGQSPDRVNPALQTPALQTPEIEALQTKEAEQNQIVTWCSAQLRRAAQDPEGVAAELAKANVTLPANSPEAVLDFLENARDAARQRALGYVTERTVLAAEARRAEASAQEQGKLVRQQTETFVHQMAPELADPKSERALEYAKVLEAFPNLKTSPNGAVIALVHTLGLEQLKALAAKAAPVAPATNGNGAAKPKLPPPPPPPRGIRPANALRLPAHETRDSSALFAVYQKSGKPADKEAWLKSTLSEP